MPDPTNLPIHTPVCLCGRGLIKHRDSAPAAVTEADQAQKHGTTPWSSGGGHGTAGHTLLQQHACSPPPSRTLTVGKPGMLKSLQMALLVSSAQSRAARFRAGLQSERKRRTMRSVRGAGTSACSPPRAALQPHQCPEHLPLGLARGRSSLPQER